jgi:hypothetical protein
MDLGLFEIISTAGFFLFFACTISMAVYAACAPDKSTRIRPLLLPAILSCTLIAVMDLGTFFTLGSLLYIEDESILGLHEAYTLTSLLSIYAARAAVLASLISAIAYARQSGLRSAIPCLILGIGLTLLHLGMANLSAIVDQLPIAPWGDPWYALLSSAWLIHPLWLILVFLLAVSLHLNLQKPDPSARPLAYLEFFALTGGIFIGMKREPIVIGGFGAFHPEWFSGAILLTLLVSIVLILRKYGRQFALPFLPLTISILLLGQAISLQYRIFEVAANSRGGVELMDFLPGLLAVWEYRPTGILIGLTLFLLLRFLATGFNPASTPIGDNS